MQVNRDTDSDSAWVARFKAGEQAALGILFTRYTALVYGTALKYLKDRDDAKDAVMQVFEKLNTLLRQHDVVNFKAWLYVTVRNHCLMHLRSLKGKAGVRIGDGQEISDVVMESGWAPHQSNEPEIEENLSKLEKCIAALAIDQQRCVRLFYLQEKCYKEVADETGYAMNQVKTYIQNGKRNLKICMERNP
jgi:RNA polymerase sigma factor (sigma-70 family)